MNRNTVITLSLIALVVISWVHGLTGTPVDGNQGEVYRILYVHVPSAFAAFYCGFLMFVVSLIALKKKDEGSLQFMKAAAEVGLVGTVMCLATGSIWGRPTWGVWWTWDPRLTTTLILGLLYAGFLLLHASMSEGVGRIRACAVLSILIFVDIPIIYKSVDMWRSIHQPTGIVENRGSNMDPSMYNALVFAFVMLIALVTWLVILRKRNLKLSEQVESATFQQMGG